MKYCFLFLVFPLFCHAQDKAIQAEVDSIIAQGKYPGIVFSVAYPNGEATSFTAGWADVESGTPMTPGNRLLSGSTGKTFVAAVLMQLIEENKLQLEDRASKWLGDEEWYSRLPNSEELTIMNLLRHQSGMERYEFKPEFSEEVLKNPDRVWKPAELIAYVLDDAPLFSAGEGFAYSDTNYILLGMIIEEIEGEEYYTVLKDRLLKPLDLTGILPTNTRKIEKLAQGYMDKESPLGFNDHLLEDGISRYNLQFEWTGGGLAFETRDYARWLKLLFEGNAFDMEKMGETYFQDIPSPEIGGSYGMGYQKLVIPEVGEAYGHSGFFPGYYTIGVYLPEYSIAVAMQVNTTEMAKLRSFFRDFVKLTRIVISNQ
ncbi:serine hydrolase domain-containing protein [Fulvivirga sedimenti]|uniref:Beta-lactamase family protein n=1 Tax=Fulvivirga sedimenti TaxID=2879465 RepID=A0A9X1L0K5_9BACT|nr:serine hydrolase domain-containing protein [Fulvivirga sedimenti]MCA6074754.1 beta-lactamase family protein [Fulvivirga sedimenti]MCA6075931.1 beta-lactamase family protein [Fulvivirga sedimenti]MCA6077059.1 beta-lactamase family protein [Fulvivirga sedimenti]